MSGFFPDEAFGGLDATLGFQDFQLNLLQRATTAERIPRFFLASPAGRRGQEMAPPTKPGKETRPMSSVALRSPVFRVVPDGTFFSFQESSLICA